MATFLRSSGCGTSPLWPTAHPVPCTRRRLGAGEGGYAAWNVGILRGNVTILAGASYFIPVFSAAVAAAVLNTPLSLSFWQGASMVCAGSILCWLATRARPAGATRQVLSQ